MSIETRGNNRYFYTKRRVGRRVVSTYVSGGSLGVLMYRVHQHEQQDRAEQRRAWAAERAKLEAADALLAELATVVHELMVATLHANGYHQHKRQWRKKRD